MSRAATACGRVIPALLQAIVDPQLVVNMPRSLTAFGGIDALVHALERWGRALDVEPGQRDCGRDSGTFLLCQT